MLTLAKELYGLLYAVQCNRIATVLCKKLVRIRQIHVYKKAQIDRLEVD